MFNENKSIQEIKKKTKLIRCLNLLNKPFGPNYFLYNHWTFKSVKNFLLCSTKVKLLAPAFN
ncbi:hypothetical protein [Clostridium grantii]|uniref:Uncharacterized protein n=1 Tax=Clostridium grantii DSM 8605 TaxID=1121316 RepID=A0A1M5XM11_9CLOT|nr:hypothetical protein [Clostridium grantii]SHI00841.1 hypothetical protein SAMN02745207_03772 [Clostridium grantii DSM 8605]